MDDKDPFVPNPPPPAPERDKKTPIYQTEEGVRVVENYQDVAEKVGLVPDFSAKRNLLQLAITAPFPIIGFIIGLVIKDVKLGLVLAMVGLIGGVFISGFVLMILGLQKKKK